MPKPLPKDNPSGLASMELPEVATTRLTQDKRRKILKELAKVVEKRFYDPPLRNVDWVSALDKHRDGIIDAPSDEIFERRVMSLLSELGSSHIGFYHESLDRSSSKMAISANYVRLEQDQAEYWVFQDVHEGGPASRAGIKPGDVLLSVDGRSFRPPEHPFFPVETTVKIEVLTSRLQKAERTVVIPEPVRKRGQLPYVPPDPIVAHRRLGHDLGYVRVAMYPGEVGVEVANDVSHAIQSLQPIRRLILDLRGNTGGGIGVLRIMSLLTPKKIQVGLFANGKAVQTSEPKPHDFAIDRIPQKKSELLPLTDSFFTAMVRTKLRKRRPCIAVMMEGLGPQDFHSRIVLLIDRHTASANEMLIAFAKENHLATIVGEPTPGRMLGGNKFKLPFGYRVALPVGEYRTSEGKNLEGTSVRPDVEVLFDAELARSGVDRQLDRAIEIASEL